MDALLASGSDLDTCLRQSTGAFCAALENQVVDRDVAQEAYKGGAVMLHEALEEDRQLLDARDQLARVDADRARSAVASFRAMRGGWSSPK